MSVNYPNNPTVGQRFTLPSGVIMECAGVGDTPIWKALPYVDNIAKIDQVEFNPIVAAEAENLTLFVDSVDGKLSFKNANGTVSKIAFEP